MWNKKTTMPTDSQGNDLQMELITDSDAGTGLKGIWSRFRKHKLAVISMAMVLILLSIALFAPLLSPYDPDEVHPLERLTGPTAAHPFGQDHLGRDILSRVIWGSRVSLSVGFIAGSLSLVVGVVLGALAGFYGGWVDNVIMRIAEIFVTIPQFLLVIAVVAALGPSLNNLMIVIGLTSWNGYARQVRAKVMQIKQLDYTEAALALGCTDRRIIFHHILPNAVVPIIVMATLNIASVIILESSLTFLGFGAQPPQSTWGSILNEGRTYILKAPHISTYPGLAIMLTVLSFNLMGDGLRDALDPKMKI